LMKGLMLHLKRKSMKELMLHVKNEFKELLSLNLLFCLFLLTNDFQILVTLSHRAYPFSNFLLYEDFFDSPKKIRFSIAVGDQPTSIPL